MARRLDLHRSTSTRDPTSTAGAPRAPVEQRTTLQLVEHPGRLVATERRDAERHVSEHLDEHAAESRHHHRPEQRVLRDADDRLDAADHLLADEDAVEAAG